MVHPASDVYPAFMNLFNTGTNFQTTSTLLRMLEDARNIEPCYAAHCEEIGSYT
jgi:hypothetical protein